MKKELLEKVYSMQKNLIVDGDISTGKTTSVLFPLVDKMIEQRESLFILDSKEEYINKYYKKLKEKNYNIIVLNLKDLDRSEGWNPLQIAYELYKDGNTDKSMDYLEKIVNTMFYEKSTTDPFWTLSASDFFIGIVLALFEDAQKDEINLNSVNMMFEGITEKFGVNNDYLEEYFNYKDPNSLAYICVSGTVYASQKTRDSILSSARQKLRYYISRKKLNILMSKTTFSFDDIVTKPTAIFFIARDESKYLNTLVAMFINQLFSIIYDRNVSNKFNFILDNFDIIERVIDFSDMLGAGLSRKIKFIVSTRSLDDLLNNYGKYITNLSNQIHVTEDLLKIKMNSKEETIENKYQHLKDVEGIQNEVEYPKLNIDTIKIFDLKGYIYNSTNYDEDELIKKIDNEFKI